VALVKAENLGVEIGGQWILRGIELVVGKGELVWISGPSGGGKSTLLRALVRLVEPAEGRVVVLGKDARGWLPSMLRRTMVMVPQQPVMAEASVADNLLLPLTFKVSRELPRPNKNELEELLGRVGLGDVELELSARRLSVGQAQRLALARALLLRPRVLLLDEPLAPLDEEATELVLKLVRDFISAGGSAVVVSHQPPGAYTTHLQLNRGRIRPQED